MPSLRETFPLNSAPTERDALSVCEWFQVSDATGATQRAVAALLLPGRNGIASDLRTARDAINCRLQVLAECAERSQSEEWTESHERQLDITARLADESQLPDGLAWDTAPPWANGLVSTREDADGSRQLVWVPSVAGDVYGCNARDFRHMKRGSGQSCSLSHERSQWLIVATRPPSSPLDRSRL